MSSNYAELRDEKVKEIEEILKFYLPEQTVIRGLSWMLWNTA